MLAKRVSTLCYTHSLFWNHRYDYVNLCISEYQTLSDWLVVLDTRVGSCPFEFFNKRLLGYITLHAGLCGQEGDTPIFRVRTAPFDYRHLVVDVGNTSGSQSTSLAFLFDESAKGNYYSGNSKWTPVRSMATPLASTFLFKSETILVQIIFGKQNCQPR